MSLLSFNFRWERDVRGVRFGTLGVEKEAGGKSDEWMDG